ncbi:hypothetical protein FN846DRAFT_957076 [Sphaerosporella brunnea]|uniref:Kinetochore protein Sos7 coiled-coil domain-containing protein n=1 Tax=Sphaerosporella brunnea TaxID=1250544 RepID=A0A5J5ES24_9PEZI|nr:hypothetical protein FN846DRAFT_957076 [Sphaerosporella brunnea]
MKPSTDLPTSLRNLRLNLHELTASISSHPPPADITASSDVDNTPTFPAALSVELLHYKELFGQLRFSYLEQITKEKFLRDITDDPPNIREAEDNAAREVAAAAAKAALKTRKKEVDALLAQLEEVAGRLASAYERLQKDVHKAEALPAETERMQAAIEAHRSSRHELAEMNLPLEDTLTRVAAAEDEFGLLETELESLAATLPRKKRQLENLEKEITEYEANKEGLESVASEAVRAREGARAAGKADMENAGQWYKSSYELLSAMLDEK